MNRFDRALGILLLLRGGQTLSAAELARRFEVSARTIYRDIEVLASVGVPVYAEQGRNGGFRLVEGYFLPPVAFTTGEATALLTGLALLDHLHATPFDEALERAAQKLLAAVPDHLRAQLARVRRIIGFEHLPHDIFHPEPGEPPAESARPREGEVIGAFLEAIFTGREVALRYRSPYSRRPPGAREPPELRVEPRGLLWDRDRWYLVGLLAGGQGEERLWRADRVTAIAQGQGSARGAGEFDIERMLGRAWLRAAMPEWAREEPVLIRMSAAQAARLRQDWYYGLARFEEMSDGQVLMTFGEDDRAIVFALLRWLGPGAELLAPTAWREELAGELRAMLAAHA